MLLIINKNLKKYNLQVNPVFYRPETYQLAYGVVYLFLLVVKIVYSP
jgi:hypothetical protein